MEKKNLLPFYPSTKKVLEVLGLIVIFLLPLERLPSWEISGITLRLPHIFFLIFITLVFLKNTHLFLTGEAKKIKIKLLFPEKILLLFFLFWILSAFFATPKERPLFTSLFFLFTLLGFFIFARFKEETDFFEIFLYSSFCILLFGLFQYFGDLAGLPVSITGLKELYTREVLGFTRIHSTLSEPLYFANFLLIPIGIILGRYFIYKRLPTFSKLVLGLAIFEIIVSSVRSAFIALLGIALAGIALGWLKGFLRESFVFVSLIFLFWFASLLLTSLFDYVKPIKAETPISFKEHSLVEDVGKGESANFRIASWSEAWRLFLKKPILGVGPGNFGVLANLGVSIEKYGYPIVNNEYLELLCETGLFGIIAFLCFLAFFIKEVGFAYSKTNDPILLGGLLTTIGILLQYLFFSTLYIFYLWVFWGLITKRFRQISEKNA